MTKKLNKKIGSLLLLIFFVAITTLLQQNLSGKALADDRLVVWIFDVGQGDAIFIDALDGQVLIDGGPSAEILEKLSAVMPFWDRSIDLVVNTHPHADHVTGLNYVLERYEVEEVWVSGQEYGTEAFAYFEKLTPNADTVFQGETYDLGEGAKLTVLWPKTSLNNMLLDDVNDGSITLLLTYGETTILLPADLGIEQEAEILDQLPHIDVLKVGHQGSMTSSGLDFLKVTTPDVAVIPVGENDYGHPSSIIVERLRSIGAAVLRTDLDGDVRIVSDGHEPEIRIFDL